MSKVICVKLAFPKFNRDEVTFPIDNLFFNTSASFKTDEFYGFTVEDAIIHPDVENIFSDIAPKENKYIIEIGAELNELYPNLINNADFFLDIKDKNGIIQKIYCSNQMAKVFVHTDKNDLFVLYNQIYKDKVFEDYKLNENNNVQYLKTFLTWQFELEGRSVKEIFAEFLDKKFEGFLSLINEYVSSVNYMQQEIDKFPLIIPSYSRFTVPYFYFIIKGNEEKIGHGIIATNIKHVAYVPDNFSNEQTIKLKDIVEKNSEINLWDIYYANGKSLIMNGQLKSGILSLFTCCELILNKYINESLLKSGVSKSKIEDSSKILPLVLC